MVILVKVVTYNGRYFNSKLCYYCNYHFEVIFEDVEESAKLTCDQFNVGDSWEEVISISHRNGFKPALDKKNAMVSFFFDGDFLDIAGYELFFEDNILTKKNVWVD